MDKRFSIGGIARRSAPKIRHAVAALSLLGVTLQAARGPNRPVEDAPSIKTSLGLKPPFFERATATVAAKRQDWLKQAEAATPRLLLRTMKPVAAVTVEKDAASFQGWKIGKREEVGSIYNRPLVNGDTFILDFGEHLTGHFRMALRRFEIPVDAPVRLGLVFGEVLAEVAEPLDPYRGRLTRSWLQDEVVNIDDVPGEIQLPRRYAFRYVKVTVISASSHGRFGFSNITAEAITSADESRLLPFRPANEADAALDRVARATLRDCMQTVFEDGPKRDRRLWLGDLRLQALANYATYRNFDLVKRSLYILAGTATDEGLVGTCSMERPQPVRGGNSILDYTALFAPTVLEYLEASGDRRTAEDLWPLVLKQLDFTLQPVGADGLFLPPKGWWLFIDWNRTLDKQAPEQAIILYGLKATLKLADKLGRSAEVAPLAPAVAQMEAAARKQLWDETQGVFVSGPKKEVSWASQAWMVLAGVPSAEQGRRAMAGVMRNAAAAKAVTPYLHHYVVEALFQLGMRSEAMQHLHSYWGGMIAKGADTFWEVYVPDDDHASPYESHLMNSYCHAWSCTPAFLLRRAAGRGD